MSEVFTRNSPKENWYRLRKQYLPHENDWYRLFVLVLSFCCAIYQPISAFQMESIQAETNNERPRLIGKHQSLYEMTKSGLSENPVIAHCYKCDCDYMYFGNSTERH